MIIDSGAEARIERAGENVRKVRPEKTFRHPDLDKRLRRSRTRREAKVLQKLADANIPAPKLISVDDKEMVVDMSFIDGPQVRDALTEESAEQLAIQIGLLIRQLHNAEVIHGDLTTSNMLLANDQVHIIDFGLSFFSQHIEDQATDLHLLKQAVHAKHPNLNLWESMYGAYNPSEELQKRFEEVELRGRYKKK